MKYIKAEFKSFTGSTHAKKPYNTQSPKNTGVSSILLLKLLWPENDYIYIRKCSLHSNGLSKARTTASKSMIAVVNKGSWRCPPTECETGVLWFKGEAHRKSNLL